MRKRIIKQWMLIFVGFTIILNSCSQNEEIYESELIALQDSNFVSAAMNLVRAKEIGKKFTDRQLVALKNNASVNIRQKDIQSIEGVKSDDGLDVFHVINYTNGGFVILSADRRTNAILAYSETNSFSTDIVPQGVDAWLYGVKTEIEDIRTQDIPYTGQDKVTPFDKEFVEFGGDVVSLNDEVDDPGMPCTGYLIEKGPLMTTTWDQIGGYNNFMPPLACVPWFCNGRAYTGCVATAMAQVIRYHEHPASWYNYAVMPNAVLGTNDTSPGATEISLLMQLAAASTNSNYNCNGTGVSGTSPIVNSFKNTFGYHSSVYKANYNSQTVKAEITNNRPVILTGFSNQSGFIFHTYSGGHAWVADGYRDGFICAEPGSGTYGWGFLYFHMNWGWGGTHNGWFNNVNSGNGNFQYNREMVVSIRKP